MKESTLKHRRYSLLAPSEEAPDLIAICPKCGGEIGLWSEEQETRCIFCDYRIFDRELTTH